MAKTNESQKTEVPVPEGKVIQPPHKLYLARKINVVKCRVDLYKIPPQCVNFKPTKTHLYVDTFKFSKKYQLEVPYPEGVQVDTEVEATFDRGVLTCNFPILSDPNKPEGHDEMVEARQKVVEMRKKGIPVSVDLLEAAKMAKVKEVSAQSTTSGQSTTPSKKGKSPLSNKEKRQKEKAKREREEEEDPTAPKKKKKTEKKKAPANKAFVDDAADALNMADAVNDQQEKASDEKREKEYAKLTVDTRKKIERQEKKAELRALRKQEADKVITSEKKPRKESQRPSKVSFAE